MAVKKPAVDPVNEILKTAEKKYNLNIGPMNALVEGTKWLTTGNIAIDNAMGGGIPLGRSVELFGPPSCGKTTTALQAAAELQSVIKSGGDPSRGISADDRIVYMDYEQAMDKTYAAALGLDTEHESFLFTQPDTLEDGTNLSLDLLKTGKVRLVVFDSLAAMTPSAKAEAEIGKSLPAVQAKLMKDYGVVLNSVLRHANATVIFLNHETEVMDMGARRPGMPPATTTSGGKATKYFASVRVQYRQIKQIKGKIRDTLTGEEIERPVATDVRVKVLKNKVAPPFREASVRVRFGRGFDNFWTALQILVANKKIRYEAGRYYFHGVERDGLAPEWMPRQTTGTQRPYLYGEAALFKAGDEHEDWRMALILLAMDVVDQNVEAANKITPLRPELEESEEDQAEALELDALLEGASTAAGNRVEI